MSALASITCYFDYGSSVSGDASKPRDARQLEIHDPVDSNLSALTSNALDDACSALSDRPGQEAQHNSSSEGHKTTGIQFPPRRSSSSEMTELRQKASAIQNAFKRPSTWVLGFGWSLALCAGSVNAIAYRRWGYYVSHVTGSTTAMGMRLEGFQQGRHDFDTLGAALSLLVSFMLGAYLCGLLIDRNQVHFRGKSLYGVALVGNAVLLFIATCVSDPLLSASFASSACGLQNAMCTSHFGAIVRTTHVTGTVTDIGSTLGRMSMIFLRSIYRRCHLNVVERAELNVDKWKLLVLLPMWCSYLIGTILGAYLETFMDIRALLVPAGVTCFVGSLYALFRQELKNHLKNCELTRFNKDIDEMSDTLERTRSFLMDVKVKTEKSNAKYSEEVDLTIDMNEELSQIMETIQQVEALAADLCTHAGEPESARAEHRVEEQNA